MPPSPGKGRIGSGGSAGSFRTEPRLEHPTDAPEQSARADTVEDRVVEARHLGCQEVTIQSRPHGLPIDLSRPIDQRIVRQRALEAIAKDLRNGKVTREAAERDYGLTRVGEALIKK